MNKDVFEGKWKQRRGQVRERWGPRRGAADDLDRVARKYDKLIGVLQEKHGYTRERAEKELNWRMAKHAAHQMNRLLQLQMDGRLGRVEAGGVTWQEPNPAS